MRSSGVRALTFRGQAPYSLQYQKLDHPFHFPSTHSSLARAAVGGAINATFNILQPTSQERLDPASSPPSIPPSCKTTDGDPPGPAKDLLKPPSLGSPIFWPKSAVGFSKVRDV